MKKIIVLIVFSFTFFAFNVDDNKIKKGKLNADELQFIREAYNWQDEEFLVISFRQFYSRCHYNNYRNLGNIEKRGFQSLFDKVKNKNIKFISVSSDEESIRPYIDGKKIFADKYDFFVYRFFRDDVSCYCLILINKDGVYMSKVGEYTHKDINSFIEEIGNK